MHTRSDLIENVIRQMDSRVLEMLINLTYWATHTEYFDTFEPYPCVTKSLRVFEAIRRVLNTLPHAKVLVYSLFPS